MTLLQPTVPTLHAEDSFRLVYHGTYGAVSLDDDGRRIVLEQVEGPLPFGRFLWDGEDYLGGLEAERAKLVPFDLVRIYFGDPRSVSGQFGRTESKKGQIGDIAPREQEIRRLSVLYGLYDTNMDMIAQAVPKVTITTADDIEVFCPAVDPEGNHVYGYAKDSAEIHDIATQLATMRQQIKLLENQAKAEEKLGAKNDGADVAEDGPPAKHAAS